MGSLTRFSGVLAALLLALGACGDDPFRFDWTADADTVLLYSIERPELNIPSAYDFIGRVALRVESATATGRWDLAVDGGEGGLFFLPPGALGVSSEAAIGETDETDFLGFEEAPRDTTRYSTSEPVPVRLGAIYVVRTHEQISAFGQRCNFFAKLEVLDVDPSAKTVTFQFDASPICNSRRLIPPD